MSRVVRVSDGNYRVITGNGQTITLDTTGGQLDGAGKVVITGDLEIQGDTTTVESTIVTIEDNIIVLSKGSQGSLPDNTSGVSVDLGNNDSADWLWRDNQSWNLGQDSNGTGLWESSRSGNRVPISTPGIFAGDNFYIQTTGVIDLAANVGYEERVFRYENGVLTPDPNTNDAVIDPNAVPNAKAVNDLLQYRLRNPEVGRILTDDTSVETFDTNNTIFSIVEVGGSTTLQFSNPHGFSLNDTIRIANVQSLPSDAAIDNLNGTFTVTDVPTNRTVVINANTNGGNTANYVANSGTTDDGNSTEARVGVFVEGSEVSSFYEDRVQIQHIKFEDTSIIATSANSDIIISAPGTGVVKVDDVFALSKTPHTNDGSIDPAVPTDGVKIYSKAEGQGKTGIYFRNENMTATGEVDELVSKKRALLFSMIF